jgi:hypothetical protein
MSNDVTSLASTRFVRLDIARRDYRVAARDARRRHSTMEKIHI